MNPPGMRHDRGMSDHLHSLDAATLHAGRAAGRLTGLADAGFDSGLETGRLVELEVQVSVAMSLAAIATVLTGLVDTGKSDQSSGPAPMPHL